MPKADQYLSLLSFNRAFLSVIKKQGRIFEAELLLHYMLNSSEVWRMKR